MRLLLITAEFPPVSSPGAVRMFDLVHDLTAEDIEVFVLTRTRPGGDGSWGLLANPHDADLFGSKDRHLYSANSRSLRAMLGLQIDHGEGLIRQGVNMAEKIARRKKIDVVFATANPLSTTILSARLKKRIGLPTVMEFRDPWTLNPLRTWKSKLHHQYFRNQEFKMLSQADDVIMNVPAARDQVLDGFNHLRRDQVHVIPHGFRAERYQTAESIIPSSKVFRVGYAGGFYPAPHLKRNEPPTFFRYNPGLPNGSTYSETTPVTFLSAFKEALSIVGDDIKAEFVMIGGGLTDYISKDVNSLNLGKQLKDFGRIALADVPEFLKSCHALCLANPGSFHGSYRSPFMSTKTVNYFAAGRPIVTVMGESDNLDMVRASGLGRITPIDDPKALTEVFVELMIEFQKSGLVKSTPEYDYIQKFERRHQALLFKLILQIATKAQPRRSVVAEI